MKRTLPFAKILLLLTSFFVCTAYADNYQKTIKLFKNAGESASYFGNSYGYAVFPSIGKGGIGIGGAHGNGAVYVAGKQVGETSMTQLTIGFQLGGQAYSQMIFLKDKRAFDEFSSGEFEFGAQATAVAITAGASAGTSTTGSSAGASSSKDSATTAGAGYHKGMAVFTIAKGGLMYEATIGGQKYSYKPLK